MNNVKAVSGALNIVSAVFFCLLTSVPSYAHLPEYLGRRYFLEPDPAPQIPEPCRGDRPALRAQIQQVEQAINNVELPDGAYTAALVDRQAELGRLYAELCNHPASLDEYRKALHSVRVNDGLMTKAQLPFLRALAKSYRAIGDVESAQNSLRQAFRIHGYGRSELDEQALADCLAYFQLARELYTDPRYRADARLFFEAYQDNREMLEAQQAGSLAYTDFERLALSHLRNQYLLLGTDPQGGEGPAIEDTSASWQFLVRTQVLVYARGAELLEDLIQRAADQPVATRARLHLRIANWHQWNIKYTRACRAYRVALALAQEANEQTLINRLSLPAELPEDEELWAHLMAPDVPVMGRAVASYRISHRGDVSRVRTEGID
ncbi:MAG: tetratricopeptide repeat protein, partial [Pseudomonadota bacterium]